MNQARASLRILGRRVHPRALVAPALAVLAVTLPVWAAETWKEPPVPPELQAALAKADEGDPSELVKLADSGRADAQVFAGTMFMFGRPKVKQDGARGCAYVEKASATRADAMHLVGLCHQRGVGGAPDAEKAKAAYGRAAEMGFAKSRCALGEMLMAEPGQAEKGIGLCKQSAKAGDIEAQMIVANAYFRGLGVKADRAEARKWYAMAADLNNPEAARRLGEMYAQGDGGKRDPKKAMKYWLAAEKAGDPLVCILVADQLFSELTGGRKPGPGQYAFRGGIPTGNIEGIEAWYQEALKRDPRPDVKQRAEYALKILGSFKTAASSVSVQKTPPKKKQ